MKNRIIVEKSVVNSYRLDGGLICIATTKNFLVLNESYQILHNLLYKQLLGSTYAPFGESLSFNSAYERDM